MGNQGGCFLRVVYVSRLLRSCCKQTLKRDIDDILSRHPVPFHHEQTRKRQGRGSKFVNVMSDLALACSIQGLALIDLSKLARPACYGGDKGSDFVQGTRIFHWNPPRSCPQSLLLRVREQLCNMSPSHPHIHACNMT